MRICYPNSQPDLIFTTRLAFPSTRTHVQINPWTTPISTCVLTNKLFNQLMCVVRGLDKDNNHSCTQHVWSSPVVWMLRMNVYTYCLLMGSRLPNIRWPNKLQHASDDICDVREGSHSSFVHCRRRQTFIWEVSLVGDMSDLLMLPPQDTENSRDVRVHG